MPYFLFINIEYDCWKGLYLYISKIFSFKFNILETTAMGKAIFEEWYFSHCPRLYESGQAGRSTYHENSIPPSPLLKREGGNRKTRKRFNVCQKKKIIYSLIIKNKILKIITFCPQSSGEPFLGAIYFNKMY